MADRTAPELPGDDVPPSTVDSAAEEAAPERPEKFDPPTSQELETPGEAAPKVFFDRQFDQAQIVLPNRPARPPVKPLRRRPRVPAARRAATDEASTNINTGAGAVPNLDESAENPESRRIGGFRRKTGTALAWVGMTGALLLLAGIVIQQLTTTRAETEQPSVAAEATAKTVTRGTVRSSARPGSRRRDPRAAAYNAGPDTSGFRRASADSASISGDKSGDLTDDDAQDELMDSYDRVGAAVKAFPEVAAEDVVHATGKAQAEGKGCPMRWEAGRPSLVFGKGGSLNQSLADCETAVTHLRDQKSEEKVEEKKDSGGWSRFFSWRSGK